MSFIATLKSFFGFGKSSGLEDRRLSCEDCRSQFIFDEGEQRFFTQKGFSDPKRCPRCRKKVKSKLRKNFRKRPNSNGNQRRHGLIDGDSPYADER